MCLQVDTVGCAHGTRSRGGNIRHGGSVSYEQRRRGVPSAPLRRGVYRTCYDVLRAAQDPRATDVLAAGHALLQAWAAQFDDEDRRRLFLANVPAHLWLRHLWEDCPSRHHGGEADAIPPRVVRPM